MVLSSAKIKAYSILVRANKYIFTESERKTSEQLLVPEEYSEAVASYLVEQY